MTTTTLARSADDASVAMTVSTNLNKLIADQRGKADPAWLRAAEDAAAGWDQRSADANTAMLRGLAAEPGGAPGLLSWGRQFATAFARNRTGYTCGAVELLPGYVEERAAASPLLPGTGTTSALAPIAARCGTFTAQPGAVNLIRWQGPLRAGPQVPDELKMAAGEPPTMQPAVAPYTGAWLPVTRQLLDDHAALAMLIDDRLRRGLGLSVDDGIVDLITADDDVPAAGSLLGAVGSLAAEGHQAALTVILNPDDYATVDRVADLMALGVGAILASAELPAGAAIVGDLRTGVQLMTVGGARVLVTDSHADMFLRNELVILAEQRVAWGVADPWALRLVTGTRTAGSKRAA